MMPTQVTPRVVKITLRSPMSFLLNGLTLKIVVPSPEFQASGNSWALQEVEG